MDVVNWLLLNGAQALHGLGGLLRTLGGTVLRGLDAVLNPVLSPLLAWVNPICVAVGDVVYAILAPLPDWLGLTLLAALAGAGMLLAFRYSSNQAAIGRARDDITANLLALKLFRDELRVCFRSQRRLLFALLRWQGHVLIPMLIMLLPMMLALGQMGTRYQWRPLHPDETTLIKLHLQPRHAQLQHAKLESSPGIAAPVGPVPGGGVLVWRVRGGEPGRHTLRLHVSGTIVEKQLVVGERLQRVSARRPGRDWTTQLLHPVERPLPADSPAQAIDILYPGVTSRIYGSDWWIAYFMLVSMLTALLGRRVVHVRF